MSRSIRLSLPAAGIFGCAVFCLHTLQPIDPEVQARQDAPASTQATAPTQQATTTTATATAATKPDATAKVSPRACVCDLEPYLDVAVEPRLDQPWSLDGKGRGTVKLVVSGGSESTTHQLVITMGGVIAPAETPAGFRRLPSRADAPKVVGTPLVASFSLEKPAALAEGEKAVYTFPVTLTGAGEGCFVADAQSLAPNGHVDYVANAAAYVLAESGRTFAGDRGFAEVRLKQLAAMTPSDTPDWLRQRQENALIRGGATTSTVRIRVPGSSHGSAAVKVDALKVD